jgi:hypothetical protein
MEDYPQCDEQVQRLAAEIWGEQGSSRRNVTATTRSTEAGERRFGQGRVIWGEELTTVLDRLDVAPDFLSQTPLRYTHRSTGDKQLYFVANPDPQEIVSLATFRVGDRAPALWWPDSGRIERPAVYEQKDGTVRIPLTLGPHASVFVVFGNEPTTPERIVTVQRGSKTILDATATVTRPKAATTTGDAAAGNFTVAMWARPSVDTTIVPQDISGVHGMGEPRNEATVATHGSSFGGDGHAGCGIAIGQNGVCIFEHGANFYSPPLSLETPITDWTHVAVVYENNQPRLFLNGRLVHTGLRSKHIVHPGSPSSSFGGDLGAMEQISRSFSEMEVVELMKSMQRPDEPLPSKAVELALDGDGQVECLFWESGSYVLTDGQGRSHTIEVPAVPPSINVGAAWDVTFQPPQGDPHKVTFDRLHDWTEELDDNIRCFSGKASYRTTFTLPESMIGKRLRLDLGRVHDLANVRLNGRELATLWMAPWQVDMGDAVQAGENVLEVEVVNAWCNRLAGDAGLPPEKRTTYLRAPSAVPENSALKPAGLIGPVTIHAAVRAQ